MTLSPVVDIPARHPGQRADVTPLLGLVARMLGVKPPTDAAWEAIGTALTIGDRPADELVEWMHTAGMGIARPLFDQALAAGIDSLADPPEPLRDFFRLVENPPSWVDWERIALGQRAFQRGGADGVYLSRSVQPRRDQPAARPADGSRPAGLALSAPGPLAPPDRLGAAVVHRPRLPRPHQDA